MLATEDIAIQPYQICCAHATIFNLFKLRGLEPPTFEELDRLLEACAAATGRKDASEGSRCADVQNVLAWYNFLTAAIVVPRSGQPEPHKVLTPFLDAGCNLILFFNWKDLESGEIVTHITLAEGYNEQGYQVIDGEPGFYPEGKPFELEMRMQPDELDAVKSWLETHSHGSRRLLPFYSTAVLPEEPLGMLPYVVVVYP
jgi:hypothetical protein